MRLIRKGTNPPRRLLPQAGRRMLFLRARASFTESHGRISMGTNRIVSRIGSAYTGGQTSGRLRKDAGFDHGKGCHGNANLEVSKVRFAGNRKAKQFVPLQSMRR